MNPGPDQTKTDGARDDARRLTDSFERLEAKLGALLETLAKNDQHRTQAYLESIEETSRGYEENVASHKHSLEEWKRRDEERTAKYERRYRIARVLNVWYLFLSMLFVIVIWRAWPLLTQAMSRQ